MLRPSDLAMALPGRSRTLLKEIAGFGYTQVHRLPGIGAFELLQHGLIESSTHKNGSTTLRITERGREVSAALGTTEMVG